MGYDLIPLNNDIKTYSFNFFVWPSFMREVGIGQAIGMKFFKDGSYSYRPQIIDGRDTGDPLTNDGYVITSDQAKEMAFIARRYSSENPSAAERVNRFADFAEKSGGFRIM